MFAQILKELRENKNISQKKLADIMRVSQQAVAKWETGKAEPDIEAIKQLSDFFEVSVNYLIDSGTADTNAGLLPVSPAERLLIEKLRRLPPDKRQAFETLLLD